MNNLKDMTMEEKKQSIQLNMIMLKKTLMETGLIIAFDKTNNKFLFLDRELYATQRITKGFEIAFDELIY